MTCSNSLPTVCCHRPSPPAALLGNERGSTAPIFAITFAGIFLMVGLAVDFGVAYNEKQRQQAALDSAMLAAAQKAGTAGEAQGEAVANAYYVANTRADTRGTLEGFKLDASTGAVSASGNGLSLTSLLRGVNVQSLGIGTYSRVMRGSNSVEIALVLDNSGSMGGQPIVDLRNAAKNLLNVVFVGAEGTDRISAALVPFAGSVNVGAHNVGQFWIDGAGASSIHYQNVSSNRTRLQLFSDMGVAWGGCVEARPSPYDTTDATPSVGTPDTLFVPMLAPDEPDDVNDAGYRYYNSYLVDDGGTCPRQNRTCTSWSRRGNCTSWYVEPLDPAVAQSRVCKYAGQAPSGGSGPNYNCTTRQVLPLTTSKSDIVTSIDQMVANGTTNIGEGVMWGVRALSPGEPYTQGRPYTDTANKKYIVLMTDGENTYSAYDNQNKSWYGAFGYAAKGRLGATHTQSAIKAEMDAKTRAACATAKSLGMVVYTVAFRLETDPNTRALLGECASGPDRAFVASDGSSLNVAFEQIGREISTIRVAN